MAIEKTNESNADDEILDEEEILFRQASSYAGTVLEQVRNIEQDVFGNQEDLEYHLTRHLFYDAVKFYDEDYARELLELAERAILDGVKDSENEKKSRNPSVASKDDFWKFQNAPSSETLN